MIMQMIQSLSQSQLQLLEKTDLYKKVWSIAEDIRLRIDLAAGSSLRERLSAHLTPSDPFFFNEVALSAYLDASPSTRPSCVGFHYFNRVSTFISEHYLIGTKYMEYLRDAVRLSYSVPFSKPS